MVETAADFAVLLSFAAVPLGAALLFALLLPPLGAGLHLRNESLLGIALPPAAAALLALFTALGVEGAGEGHGHGWIAFTGIALGLGALVAALPPGAGPRRISLRQRALLLAAVFTLGNATLLLIMALSPRAQAHLFNVLNGELLAVGAGELLASTLVALLLAAGFTRYRGYFLAYFLDEETLRVRLRGHRLVALSFHLLSVLAVTTAVLLIGPVLCTALLILPPLLTERRARGLVPFLIAAAAVGVTGTATGFLTALLFDLPPAPTAAAGLLAVGVLYRLLPARTSRAR